MSSPRYPSARRTSFTLVEVMVALTVLTTGVLACIGALKTANDAEARVRDESAARLMAEQHMVRLLAKPANQLQPARGTEERFTWVESMESGKLDKFVKLIVKVTWATRSGLGEFELVSFRETE